MSYWIAKATRKPRKGPSRPDVLIGDAKLSSLAKTLEASTRASLTRGISTLRRDIEPSDIMRALSKGDVRTLMQHIGPAMRDPIAQAIKDTHGQIATHGVKAMPQRIADKLRFSPDNPNIKKYIKQSAGQLITTSEKGLKQAVRAVTTKAIGGKMTQDQAADVIRGSLGLTAPQATALATYKAGLIDAGDYSKGQIRDMAEAKANDMLDNRAMMIAQHEIREAQNQAQIDIWNTAADQELIPDTSQKVWVVDGDPCEEWCAQMDGEAVGIDDLWYVTSTVSGATRAVYTPSGTHVRCKCTVALSMGTDA